MGGVSRRRRAASDRRAGGAVTDRHSAARSYGTPETPRDLPEERTGHTVHLTRHC
ncbi:hypothetical protein JYU34_010915 [Plutella xylostella]|uniref:Uncharacterized protein n=1 Tax=Plutella xylostella TaxID=51655 RepID=A0ABQ7QGW2_PLUXY|nr:hypothetical protein JYU34_010915 [Plutella xylostella]